MARQKLALAITDWPTTDRKLWSRAFESRALFDVDGAGAHWAAATKSQVQNGYALWLGHLARQNVLTDQLPCSRLVVAWLATYVQELSARVAPVSVASRMRDLAEALRVMEPDGDRRLVTAAVRRLEAHARPSRDLRQRLVAPTTIYEAGIGRMERVQSDAGAPMLRAVHYSDGLRLAMLAAKPVRLKNLVETRIGRNLARVGDTYFWRFARSETKTGQAIDAELPGGLTIYIDRWIDQFRRDLLQDVTTDALWISLEGRQMGRAAVYERVCKATTEELGVRINPHAFRHIVATSVAIVAPEHVRMTPFLLDHSSDRTVQEHYNLADRLTASGRYLTRLETLRHQALSKSEPRR